MIGLLAGKTHRAKAGLRNMKSTPEVVNPRRQAREFTGRDIFLIAAFTAL